MRRQIDNVPTGSTRLTDYVSRDKIRELTGTQRVKLCIDVYKTVGVCKNIIDLMSDFASEGVRFVHHDEQQQKFWVKWAEHIRLFDRCERYMNNLLKAGFVAIRRVNKKASISPPFVSSKVIKAIPSDYIFLNPLQVEIYGNEQEGGHIALFRIPQANSLTMFSEIDKRLLKKLSPSIEQARRQGKSYIVLDPSETWIDFWKKDDYEVYADPFHFAAIPDIAFYEKTRAMDVAAMEGIINAIIIWKLGTQLNNGKVLWPDKSAFDKLNNLLQNARGGGTVDVIWGPFIETEAIYPPVDKILGSEKYEFIKNEILSDFGIPQILITGQGQGSYSNQFLAVKSLIEKLEYLRERFCKWINNEIAIVAKAMNWKELPLIDFEYMNLRDETNLQRLVIQLFDRNIVSKETTLEFFTNSWQVEKMRISREKKEEGKEENLTAVNPYTSRNENSASDNDQNPASGFDNPANGRPQGTDKKKQTKKRDTKPKGSS
jgi:hypothetical protein